MGIINRLSISGKIKLAAATLLTIRWTYYKLIMTRMGFTALGKDCSGERFDQRLAAGSKADIRMLMAPMATEHPSEK